METKVLVFQLGDGKYSIFINEVDRLLNYTNITPAIDMPSFVEGVIDYEGRVIPIINLCNKFKIAGSNKVSNDSKLIVVKSGNFKFGISVNKVNEVFDLDNGQLNEIPELIINNTLAGVFSRNQEIVFLIDCNKILTMEEKEQMF